ncbi:MAG: hypothetical protein P8L89_07870 [Polaribacter sp.]|nr:hypothetical protein [Polaribacter sp.]
MIQSYKKNPTLAENYDSIIIGSGMGSLTAGAILAKEGQKSFGFRTPLYCWRIYAYF